MGERGPTPKRSSERRRRNKESKPDQVSAIVTVVEMPKPNSRWHPIAKRWYLSLEQSGQSKFFEPSDWAAAYYVADVMSRNVRQEKFSAVLFASVWSAMGDLLTTEGERRRVRMEIERPTEKPGQPASVAAIADYRRRVGG